MGILVRSASHAANTSPPIAEPPIPTMKIRCASPIGTGAALPTFMPVASCSGSDAMMSRIPPGSMAATARASSIRSTIHGDEIRAPLRPAHYQQNSSYKYLDIFRLGSENHGLRARHCRSPPRGIRPRLRWGRPRGGDGPDDCERGRHVRRDPDPPPRGWRLDLHDVV